MQIKEINAKSIFDSRKEQTIEVSVNGQKASSPSGKSKGKYETPSYCNNLSWNIKAINSLKMPFKINSFHDLKKLESHIAKKFKLKDAKQFGANALFALESAVLKALARHKKKQLFQIINLNSKKIPVPVGNAIGGGIHSHNKNAPEFQEFLIIPQKKSIKENVDLMNKIHEKLKKTINAQTKNDEGAWQTTLSNDEVLKTLSKFKDIKIGIDVAASSFYKDSEYQYKSKSLDASAQIFYLNSLIKKYNIFYLEDPLEENDFKGFSKIIKKYLVVGDDLTATNISRLKNAISSKSINAMIIKPNQNGSLFELEKVFRLCKKHKIKTIISHRSGETLDSALADYAVAFQADFIKTGISTKYREIKLHRLIEIKNSFN